MSQISFYIHFFLQELRVKRWLFLLIIWLISLFGIIVVIFIPNQYKTRAGISIDTDQLLSKVVDNTTFSLKNSTIAQAQKVSQIVYATDNLRKVLRKTYPRIDELTAEREIILVEDMRKNLTFQSVGLSKDYYEMTYTHSDPDIAYNTLREILSTFIETNITQLSSNSEQAELVSADTLKTRQREYAVAQKQFADFQKDNLVLIDPNGLLSADLNKYRDLVENYELDRQRLSRRITNLRSLVAQTPKVIGGTNAVDPVCSTTKLQSQINAAKARGLTESHPDIIYLKELLRVKEDSCANAGTKRDSSNNPAYLQLLAELQLAQENIKTLEKKYQQARESIPALEAKLARRPLILEKLETLRKKKDKAEKSLGLADLNNDRLQETIDLNRKTGLVNFDVIQKVLYPLKPEKPNRILLFIGCMLASVAGAAGLIILRVHLEQRMPTVYHLREAFNLPILGTISKVEGIDKTDSHAGSNIMWSGGIGFLLLLYIFVIWFYAVNHGRVNLEDYYEKIFLTVNMLS
ncbi:MAG: hypothetical protein AAF621_05735 [Pseudomonadota bacterium]